MKLEHIVSEKAIILIIMSFFYFGGSVKPGVPNFYKIPPNTPKWTVLMHIDSSFRCSVRCILGIVDRDTAVYNNTTNTENNNICESYVI